MQYHVNFININIKLTRTCMLLPIYFDSLFSIIAELCILDVYKRNGKIYFGLLKQTGEILDK